jgi:tetratricopeptide (TPR) repeat protein
MDGQLYRNPVSKNSSEIESIQHLIDKKKFKEALAEIREIESGERLDKFSVERGKLLYFLSVVLYNLGRYSDAVKEARIALQVLKVTTENKLVAQVQCLLGATYVALGQFERAEADLRDAIASYKRIDDIAGITATYNKLAISASLGPSSKKR